MWKYIKEKYDIPDKEKTWAFESIGTAWRKYKKQLKKNHFKAYENAELRMENRPLDVSESHFKDLLKYWNSDPYKKMSKTNKENRNKLRHPCTNCKTSFVLFREAKQKKISDTLDTLSS
nr:uncharacterized protein LOC104100335 isoform X3 [Nicotiana tomentosiformis]